jgi:peptide/nickel transport system ATP-binding protein
MLCTHLRAGNPLVSGARLVAMLEVRNLVVEFATANRNEKVHAVSDVSFTVQTGETLGVVGESGCGKSTTGRAIMQLVPSTSGEVIFDGVSLGDLNGAELREVRTQMQMIFQDPISSLNPQRSVRDIVAEPLFIWKRGTKDEIYERVDEILELVGIDPQRAAESRPHQFSGGQCQRISIARALMLNPRLLICDEPVSALDVSVQAQVLNLLESLKEKFNLTLIFIAHDLAVVKNISDRVAVMYLGRMCEVAKSDSVYSRPRHPYTKLLIESIPIPDPQLKIPVVETIGEPPSPINPPSGCRFHTRCPYATDLCVSTQPELTDLGGGHLVACHHPLA